MHNQSFPRVTQGIFSDFIYQHDQHGEVGASAVQVRGCCHTGDKPQSTFTEGNGSVKVVDKETWTGILQEERYVEAGLEF